MVAAQGHHQIGRQVVVVDLRGAVLGGVAVRMQHPGGPHVGAAAPTCQSPVPALVTRTASPRPRRRSWSANIFSAIGDRQMLPVQTNVTCSGIRHP